jgi:hypothetical protein
MYIYICRFMQSFDSLSIAAQFVFDIFCAGLSSPAGMILVGSHSVAHSLSVWSQSTGLILMLGLRFLGHVTTVGYHHLAHNFIKISQSILSFFTGVLQVVIPTVSAALIFLYDVFHAGLSSPAGMILSGSWLLEVFMQFSIVS